MCISSTRANDEFGPLQRAPHPARPTPQAMETLKDELLNLAFQLAHFIHNDKELAKRIAIAALEKLETAALAQDKRLYYPGRRNKVSMSELHLLQRLVYAESETHERAREQNVAAPPSEEVLLIHFIKHLAKITARRNAMHVTLGVCRLLHQYTTPETTEIYNAVLQDPGRVPSEDYFRSRKKTLMEEMKKRFGSLVNTTRGTRGEERFVAHAQPERFIELTRECLNAFTPWLTACCVPEKFALAEGSLSNLAFHGGDPDAEHSIEINRFHAILHPVCFERLVVGLGYAHPATRLEIPRFFLSSPNNSDDDEQNPNPPNRTSAKLNDEERNAIRRYLNDQARRRKYLSAGLLLFVADGELLAQLDPQQTASIKFALPEHAEFIEVRTRDAQGELLLATHAVLYDDEDQPLTQRAAITLEGGQRLTFEITPTPTSATVTVNFTETSPAHALRQWLQQHNAPSVLLGSLWQPALGLALLLALTGGLAWLLLNRPTVTPTDIVKTASPTPLPSPIATVSPTPAASPTAAISTTPQPRPTTELYWPNDDVLVTNLRSTDSVEELTRNERESGSGLRDAKKVFLQVTGGNAALRELVSAQLRSQLPQALPYILTADQNAADIALKLRVEPAKPSRTGPRLELSVSIINADLKVIWPLTPGLSGRKYSGPTGTTSAKFIVDLATDLRR